MLSLPSFACLVLNKILPCRYDDDWQEYINRVNRVYAVNSATEEKNTMSEKFETQQVSFEDALQMQIYTSQALMDVLVDKGIVTYQEILARVEALKKEHHLEISAATEH